MEKNWKFVRQGIISFMQNKKIEDNPYQTEFEHKEWAFGWRKVRDIISSGNHPQLTHLISYYNIVNTPEINVSDGNFITTTTGKN